MKTALAIFASVLVILTCGCRGKQPTDSSFRSKLTGSWNVTLVDVDGSTKPVGTLTVAANNNFQAECVTLVSNELQVAMTKQGIVHIEDGYLVKTTTNVIVHWRPEASGTGSVTFRHKIVRMNEHEIATDTNEFGSVFYTKIRQ